MRHLINLIYDKRKIEPLVGKQKHSVSVGGFARSHCCSSMSGCQQEISMHCFYNLEKYMLPPVSAALNSYRFHPFVKLNIHIYMAVANILYINITS